MNRLHLLGGLVGLAILCAGCGGSSALDNETVPVFLTVEIREYNPEVNLCTAGGPNGGADLTIADMVVQSQPKDPGGTLTANQDVTLTEWEVSPRRTDGGTVVSPDWVNPVGVYVAAGGQAALENYRVYPNEYLSHSPFIYLLPENGGVDPETGEIIIRESLRLVLHGRTVSGEPISTESTLVAFRFFCN